MLSQIRAALRPAFVLLIASTLLLGIAYPLFVTGAAQLVMPAQANGSLVRDGDTIVGSALIGQNFEAPRYFHSRPSAAGKGYDAANSSGSNLAPGSKDLANRIAASVKALREGGVIGTLPGDLVTTSASGLDPDISLAAAQVQVARVARARGIAADGSTWEIGIGTAPAAPARGMAEVSVTALVAAQLQSGLLGEPRVNVLAINRELDWISLAKAAKSAL